MNKLRQYIDTDWFIILYIISMFIGNTLIFNILPCLNNLPIWLLYICLIIGGSISCIFGLLIILFVDTKLEEKRTLKKEYSKK